MKKLVVFLAVVAIALAGCAGQKEENTAGTPAQTQTPTPEETQTQEMRGSGGASAGEIRTLYDLFVSKKMYYGRATITENGETYTVEFWYYYDADNGEQMIRMENSEGGIMIMRNKYEGTTLTTTMYMRGMKDMPMPEGCDWIEIKTTQTVSPTEAEEIKDESVGDAFTATLSYQGQMTQEYEGKFVDVDLTLFQPDGNVCSMMSMTMTPQG